MNCQKQDRKFCEKNRTLKILNGEAQLVIVQNRKIRGSSWNTIHNVRGR